MTDEQITARVGYTLAFDDGPEDEWWVQRFECQESLGEPYELVADIVSKQDEAEPAALLGADAALVIGRGDARRRICGVVAEVVDRGFTADGHHAVRVRLVPALALAMHRVDSRIFQEHGVPEILNEVLGDALSSYGRATSGRFSQAHRPRDYCVQYRESDLGFARRLMEEDGLIFVFEQPDDGPERLVLLDDNNELPKLETAEGGDELWVVDDVHELSGREVILEFGWRSALGTTAVSQADYDLRQPSASITYTLDGTDRRGRRREVYRHGGRRWVLDDGEREAELERQGRQRGDDCGVGSSNVVGLAVGRVFTLQGDDDRPGQRLIVTRVLHRGIGPDDSTAAQDGQPSYSNRFECVSADVPLRLERSTPKPHVHGPETATVTGPQGEEIHTDELGRVKVAFHWDRLGSRDERSSCWLRVAQASAGQGFGAMVLPRMGMEVVVDFLAGNPDRPLVTGCVYNGANAPPYPLPDEKTKTTMRTQSSPGGDGFNELTFEDRAGGEQVYLHAQRDLVEKVRHDEAVSIGNDRRASVGRHDSLSVGGDQHVTVDGNQTITVKGGGKTGTKGTIAAIEGSFEVRVTKPGHVLIDAATSITLQCGASSITIDPTTIRLSAGAGTSAMFDVSAVVASAGGATAVISDAVALRSAAGTAMTLDSAMRASSAVGSTLALDDTIQATSAGAAKLVLDQDVALTGKEITAEAGMGSALELGEGATLTAFTTVTCTAGGEAGGQIELDGTGVGLDGAKIKIAAAALAELTGKLVKIN